MDVIDDKERKAKKVDGKDEVKLRRRRTRRRWADEMDDERRGKIGDEVDEREVEGGEEEGEVGDRREGWQGWRRIIDVW